MNRSRLNLAGDNDAHNHHQEETNSVQKPDSNRCRISENLDSDRLKDVESSSSLASSFTSSVSMEFDDDNLRISPSTETYDHDDEDDNDDQDREEEYLFEENILDNNLGRDWNIAMENDGWNDERMENDEDHYNNENNFQFRLDEGQDEEDIRQDYLPTFQKESIKKFRKISAGRKKNLYAKNNFQNQIVQTNRSGLFDRKTSNHQQSRRPFQVLIQSPKFSSVSRSSSPSTTNDSNRLRNNRPNFWGNRSNLQDENGVARRSATKLNSYVAKYRSKYYFYFDLINGNYPQLVRKLSDDTEIWRMCFNIYSSGLRNNLIIHLGEIHAFYQMNRSINENQMEWIFKDFNFYQNKMPFGFRISLNVIIDIYYRFLKSVCVKKDNLLRKFPNVSFEHQRNFNRFERNLQTMRNRLNEVTIQDREINDFNRIDSNDDEDDRESNKENVYPKRRFVWHQNRRRHHHHHRATQEFRGWNSRSPNHRSGSYQIIDSRSQRNRIVMKDHFENYYDDQIADSLPNNSSAQNSTTNNHHHRHYPPIMNRIDGSKFRKFYRFKPNHSRSNDNNHLREIENNREGGGGGGGEGVCSFCGTQSQ